MLDNVIGKIRIRPGMYLGGHSITALKHYLNGYSNALSDCGIYNISSKMLLPLNFRFMHEFVSVAYGYYESTLGWANIILENVNGNEHAALDRFFEVYDEFKSIHIYSVKRAVLSDDNIQYCNVHGPYRSDYNFDKNCFENRVPVINAPHTVCIFTLITDSGISFDLLVIECLNETIIKYSLFSDTGERAKCGTALEYAQKLFGEISFEACSNMDNYKFKNTIKEIY